VTSPTYPAEEPGPAVPESPGGHPEPEPGSAPEPDSASPRKDGYQPL